MNLRWGHNNVCIKEGNEWKAAFVCYKEAYKPLVMYFGLCNSLATFQAMMNEIFADMEDIMVVYIDDLLIFTKTNNQNEHDQLMHKVLQRLEENNIFVKLEKCFFLVKEVEFLSITVGVDGIKMINEKIKAILEWPKGSSRTTLSMPLNDLLKKDQLFE